MLFYLAISLLLLETKYADASFVYNESNVLNYSYPGNWSYVPCEASFGDGLSCEKLAGNGLVGCIKQEM